jgi:formate hydrogenlyase subunit 3/multisubunit Na+/H+ antiporter MnhD subunit
VTPIPGPLIVLLLPLLAAGATYVVRRWTILAAFLAAGTAGALAVLCLRLPLDRSAFVLGQEVSFGRPVVILTREMVLDPAGRIWLAGIFALAAVFYLLAWRIPQGRLFFPFSLAILSLYALITLLHTFSLAVLVFSISVTLAVFILQNRSGASVRGAQRYLLVTLLAVPLLLAAAWLIDQSVLVPDNADMARQAFLPATLGFGLLLAVFPFGTWMPAIAADAPPIATAFVFTAGQAMALFLVLVFLRDAPWALNEPALPVVVQLAGLVMAASGGIMAAAQRDFGRLFGYAALSDMGFLLLAFVAGGSQSQTLVLLHTVNRAVSITLMAAALASIRYRAATDGFSGLGGVAQRLPIATTGLMIGGLALAGFPLTAGLPTRWAVSRAVWSWAQPIFPLAQSTAPGSDPVSGGNWVGIVALVALLASSVGILIGLFRGLSAMLGADPREDVARQPVIASLMILALIGLVIVLGIYPQLFLETVESAAQVFSSF